MKKIIGIDLGTTTSGVGVYLGDEVKIIPSPENENLIDSVVAVDMFDGIIIGKEAKNDFTNGIREIKRKMGTNYIAISGDQEFLPEEVSAEILKYIKDYAEEYIGEEITEAVITVPANFNSFQKMATIKAAELAGLKVERIVNEPTAAALAYGLDKLENEEKIIVYDFGGGTFDVSILDFDMGIMDVIAGDGDNELGGKNIDEILMIYLSSINNINYKVSDEIRNLFKNAVEQAKIDLSYNEEVDIIIPELNLSTTLTKNKFQELIKDTVDKTLKFIDSALKQAKLTEKDIKVVLPVGGTCNIPYIQERLKEKFVDSEIYYFDNLQEIVTLGAAVQGAIKSGHISSETGIILTDICSHDLGVSCISTYQGMEMSGVFSSILERHTPLPGENEKTYYTSKDNQTEIAVKIYEGKEALVMENIYIGELLVNEIPPNKAGYEKININFGYDLNGILKVKVTVVSTGKITEGKFEVRKKIDKNSLVNESYKSSIYYSDYKTIMELGQGKLENTTEEIREAIKDTLNRMKEELIKENKSELEELEDKLLDFIMGV